MSATYLLKPPSVVVPSDPATLGYLAGILDGEGYLGCADRGGRLRPQIAITNSSRALMDWLLRLGGTVRIHGRAGRDYRGVATNHDVFAWRLCGMLNLKSLLVALSPFLVIKRDRALSLVAAIDERISNPPSRSAPLAQRAYWSADQLATLRENSHLSLVALGELLGRSPNSVAIRRSALGLNPPRRATRPRKVHPATPIEVAP